VDHPADPANGIDKQLGAGHRRLLCVAARSSRERRDRKVDG
jgi:hypothetical protein